MKTIIVTGPIGAGKSYISGMLRHRGIPVYDCDSAVKKLYVSHPELSRMVSADIFNDQKKLDALESALFPVLEKDFIQWTDRQGKDFVAMESATILQKEYFDHFGDYVLLVHAGKDIRLGRALARGGITEESIRRRMALQTDQTDNPRVSCIIDNSGSGNRTAEQLDEFLKQINYYGNTEN